MISKPVLAAVPLAVIALGVALHTGWLVTRLWILALPLLLLIFVVLVTLFGLAIWRAGRDTRRWPVVATAVLALAGLGGGLFLHLEPQARARARFWVERPAFAVAAGTRVPEGQYYGAELPGWACFVSANCRVAVIGTSGGRPVRFVPDWIGVPDDAVGYGHFTGRPEAGPYNGFGASLCPSFELAGGWWWLGRC
ncbi:hypothetical protein ACIBHY_24810 [Nonomuraea sp. NPDC050547]|uniref:hypothetical protein n=1 Tax=unclassified Nonomuraea TaxID=2593643 RepID=UPI0037AAB624